MTAATQYSLFDRALELQVGESTIPLYSKEKGTEVLHASFTIERSKSKEPNRATISIINLGSSNRKKLQDGALLVPRNPKGDVLVNKYTWPIIIRGGYKENIRQLFSGDITFVKNTSNHLDWVTAVEAQDGGRQYTSKRINQSFKAGTTVSSVLNAVAAALDVGLGNSAQVFADSAAFRKKFTTFKKGVTIRGKCSEVLNKYVKSIGYTWSIQDGQLQILGLGKALLDSEIIVTPDTGLIGTPEIGEKGIVTATVLLQGEIKPGRQVSIESSTAEGKYRVQKVTHTGDTSANPWYSTFEGEAIQ